VLRSYHVVRHSLIAFEPRETWQLFQQGTLGWLARTVLIDIIAASL
jgi:hypothetical protein